MRSFNLQHFFIHLNTDSAAAIEAFRGLFSTVTRPSGLATRKPVHLHIDIDAIKKRPKPPALPPAASYRDIRVFRRGGEIIIYHDAGRFGIDPQKMSIRGKIYAPEWQTAQPIQQDLILMSIMSLMRYCDVYALHAACLSHPQGSLVCLGDSGSGKSTLAMALLSRGWKYLSDDAVLLHPDARQKVAVYPLRRKMLLYPESMQNIIALTEQPHKNEKIPVDPEEFFGKVSIEKTTPGLLIITSISPQLETTILPADKGAAMYQLMRQSALQAYDGERTPRHLETLKYLVQQCRCYRLLAGRDVLDAPANIAYKLLKLLKKQT